MNRQTRILLVEDDPNMGYLLETYLKTEGFQVKLCQDGASGWKSFQQQTYDLCILDIMLPLMDGFSLGKRIRTSQIETPIIFLTARTRKEDKLKGFRLGADDYLTKPFDEEELLCRIHAVLRRCTDDIRKEQQDEFRFGNSCFFPLRQTLSVAGRIRTITEKECEILQLLLQFRNQVVRREEFLMRIWGKNDYFLGRSLDVFISKLRKYLAADQQVKIETVFGVGFMLSVDSF